MLSNVNPTNTLVVCTNANYCGRPSGGFGTQAVACLRTLAPPSSLRVLPGPCLTRCSSGVNAKLVTAAELEKSLPAYASGATYRGLNDADACAGLLNAIGLAAEPEVVQAYSASLRASTPRHGTSKR